MTRQEALQHILTSNGKIFAVDFVKRSNNELRHMVCRLGVTKHLSGEGPSYDFAAKGLVCVFDMSKHAYRTIPVEGIVQLKVGNTWHKVEG